MKICPKCGREYESGNFCEDCENEDENPVRLEEKTIKCPNCGRQYKKETKFCSECGVLLGQTEVSCSSNEISTIQNKVPLNNPFSIEMVSVEEGALPLGELDWDMESFMIGKYPVTQKEWVEIMGYNPSKYKDKRKPVTNVTWYDTIDFCNKLSKKEGLNQRYCFANIETNTDKENHNHIVYAEIEEDVSANGYKLPTIHEWDFAFMGGNKSQGYKYSGSNIQNEVSWYAEQSDDEPHEVGAKKPNELGIHDMGGNVGEWCNDSSWSDEGEDLYYIRGGSWSNEFGCKLRTCARGGSKDNDLGFRVVCNSKND